MSFNSKYDTNNILQKSRVEKITRFLIYLFYNLSNILVRAIGLDSTRDKFATAKTVEYLGDIFLNFQNYSCYEKYLKDNRSNNLHSALRSRKTGSCLRTNI